MSQSADLQNHCVYTIYTNQQKQRKEVLNGEVASQKGSHFHDNTRQSRSNVVREISRQRLEARHQALHNALRVQNLRNPDGLDA